MVQAGTVYRPTGWEEKPAKMTINDQEKDGFEIVNTGRMPWQGQITDVRIKIKNTRIRAAYLLDQAGYISREIDIEKNADHINITLPENTMYLVLKGSEPTAPGAPEGSLRTIKLYPNPSKGTVMLDIPDYINSVNFLQVFDNSGRLVHTEKNLTPGQKMESTTLISLTRIIKNQAPN